MRYELNAEGYVMTVVFGCMTGNCIEYTGTVPEGYNSLEEWVDNAYINAYKIDSSGNLVLDTAKQAEIIEKEAQELEANTPLLKGEFAEVVQLFEEAIQNLQNQINQLKGTS